MHDQLSMSNSDLKNSSPLIKYKFPKYNPIGFEEIDAVKKLCNRIFGFIARGKGEFNGGPKVKEFEENCKSFLKLNTPLQSILTPLICAVGALDLEPADEILVSPWTMCATATAILHWNCIPKFVDIDNKTYCLNPELLEKHINERTKAIMSVDIGGHPHYKKN